MRPSRACSTPRSPPTRSPVDAIEPRPLCSIDHDRVVGAQDVTPSGWVGRNVIGNWARSDTQRRSTAGFAAPTLRTTVSFSSAPPALRASQRLPESRHPVLPRGDPAEPSGSGKWDPGEWDDAGLNRRAHRGADARTFRRKSARFLCVTGVENSTDFPEIGAGRPPGSRTCIDGTQPVIPHGLTRVKHPEGIGRALPTN